MAVAICQVASAVPLTIADALGSFNVGTPASAADDMAAVNVLVGMANNGTPPPSGTATYVLNSYPEIPYPLAADPNQQGGGSTVRNATGYEWLVAKYENGASWVWYLAGINAAEYNLPAWSADGLRPKTPNQHTLFNGQNGPSQNVPDAGSTSMLLAMALTGLGFASRKFQAK